MKHYLFSCPNKKPRHVRTSLSCFVFIFSFFVLAAICGSAFNSFSQTAKVDTNYILTHIGLCKAAEDLQCGNDLLKLVQQKITEIENGESATGHPPAGRTGISAKLREKLFYQKAEIKILRNIGNVYSDLYDLPKAIDYYQMSRKKAEAIGDKLGLAAALLNIGNRYSDLSDYPKALDYQGKSLKIFREIKDARGIGICLNNLGSTYKNQSNYSKALEYFQYSLTIQQERADTFEIMTCYNNIGTVYENILDFSKARKYYQTGLRYAEKINDAGGIILSLSGIANILNTTGNNNEAEKYYNEALKLANESGSLFIESEIYKTLRDLLRQQGRYKEALTMFDKHIALRDTIFSQEKGRDISRKAAKYEFEKKEEEIKAEQKRKDAVAAAEKRKQQIITWAVGGGLFLVILFAGFILRSLRVTRKQKDIIETQKKEVENQKHLVEEKQKEIIDSITYAKRLQEAILPPLDFVNKHFPDSFILYEPKDIVAGDFYWMEAISDSEQEEKTAAATDDCIFIAAADCTGHGVPGAMVSLVCSNALNRTVKEFGLRDTGKILDKVTELVLETFEKSGEDVKDGMDISLIAINKTTGKIQWSGANNPLLYVQDGKLIEIRANKQPIGKHDNRIHFTSHSIACQPNTTFYLFTDGYADQFGGTKGKKFKYKQLEEQLLAVSKKPLVEQKRVLEKIFVDWKGNLDQVDDVCIIGIKI